MRVLQINLQKHMHVNVSFGNISFMEANCAVLVLLLQSRNLSLQGIRSKLNGKW